MQGRVAGAAEFSNARRQQRFDIGLGVKEIVFSSTDPQNPARFYINSAPAHKAYPTVKILRKDIEPRCAYCAHGSAVNEREVACSRRGVR